MRTAVIKGFSLGLLTGSFFTAGAVLLAGPAKADPDNASIAYASVYGAIVCQVLDEYPSESGIFGVGQAIVEDGLTYEQAGYVVALSVGEICPRHTALISQFARDYGSQRVA